MTNTGDNLVSGGQLRSILERVERLELEKKAISEDIADIYKEAAANGFCKKTIRKIVSLRKQDENKRREEEEILELYLAALGDLATTPLGQAAVAREFGGRTHA